MKSLRNIVVILVLLGVAGAFFGPKVWKSRYVQPRKALAEQKAELESRIEAGRRQVEMMQRVNREGMSLYTRSFPLQTMSAHIQYQIWLTQLAEFCGFQKTEISVGNSSVPSGGVMSHYYRLRGECSAEQLYRFLYEFYWTGYLHRIDSLDIQTSETSNLLTVAFLFEGLTMAKVNGNQPWPNPTQLPGPNAFYRQLASSPWKAYQQMSRYNIFQFTRPGIDDADWTVLAAIPTSQSADGKSITVTRWFVQTTEKTLVVPVGGELSVGTFAGTVDEVIDDMVVLKQSNGYKWVIGLGDRLANAACIPEEY